ncbi:hypothetical protein [Pararhodonellum marinum]|uniref:hypothetical protein n=1 Tax=Pararhodonellum marinum TaxID=2755358 RepID=UPI0018909BCA|nr:hypothetical protein [Pararhodonellum marinum]
MTNLFKKYSFILSIVLIQLGNFTCTKVSDISAQNLKQDYLEKIVLIVDNLDTCKPGFGYFKDSESIAINSIILDGSFCLLLDPYHSNIKKVNLLTGEVKCSDSSVITSRPVSLITSEGLIYVLTYSTTSYIFNEDLKLIKEFDLPTNKKYFVGFEGEYIILFNFLYDEIITISKNGDIIEKKSGNFDFQRYSHGKAFEIVEKRNSSFLKTETREFDLGRKFPHTWDYYDSFNVDFDDKKIVYFSSNPDSLVIYVKKIEM